MNSLISKLIGMSFALILWLGLVSLTINATALDHITMDIDSDTLSGTFVCENVERCHQKVRNMNARGADQYCNEITIKKNDTVVWHHDYWESS
jgi:hypothetical protein